MLPVATLPAVTMICRFAAIQFVDPMGITLGEIGERSGIAVADATPQRVAEVRSVNPPLANRRFTVVASA